MIVDLRVTPFSLRLRAINALRKLPAQLLEEMSARENVAGLREVHWGAHPVVLHAAQAIRGRSRLDFNRAKWSESPISVAINTQRETAALQDFSSLYDRFGSCVDGA